MDPKTKRFINVVMRSKNDSVDQWRSSKSQACRCKFDQGLLVILSLHQHSELERARRTTPDDLG